MVVTGDKEVGDREMLLKNKVAIMKDEWIGLEI